MKITPVADLAIKPGPAEYFTGRVWLDEIASAGARIRAVRVTFEPRARTAWHTHPHGQTLHILSGVGRLQVAGSAVVEVHPGDTVWFEPGERHWHGAAPGSVLVHLAIQELDTEGRGVSWQEHVSEVEYESHAS